jgi:hypothetical protein
MCITQDCLYREFVPFRIVCYNSSLCKPGVLLPVPLSVLEGVCACVGYGAVYMSGSVHSAVVKHVSTSWSVYSSSLITEILIACECLYDRKRDCTTYSCSVFTLFCLFFVNTKITARNCGTLSVSPYAL